MPLTVEEQLSAAAHRILTDGQRHCTRALVWAWEYLHGRYVDVVAQTYPLGGEGLAAW